MYLPTHSAEERPSLLSHIPSRVLKPTHHLREHQQSSLDLGIYSNIKIDSYDRSA